MAAFVPCCVATCPDACPDHAAKASYAATVTGLAHSLNATLTRDVTPSLYCFFSGSGCHLTGWVEKSAHETGSPTWGPFTWPAFNPAYTLTLNSSSALCSVGFPSSHPTQRRWQSAVLTNQKFRLLQQDRYEISLSIINYGPLNQLALTATVNYRFCSTWQSMIGLSARWRANNTRWDDIAFAWDNTFGSDSIDTMPASPSFPSKPYRQDVIGYVPDLASCNWDYVADDYASSWPQKEIGRWDRMTGSGTPCELDGDVAATVLEPQWETKLIASNPFALCGPPAGLGYNVSYTYESDPFLCDAIPPSIQLKKYPSYTDVAASTQTINTVTGGCGTFVTIRDYAAIPKDLYVALV